MTGERDTGHPLPASDEARHGEIPESLAEKKGEGEDGKRPVRPDASAAAPDGRPYPAGDLEPKAGPDRPASRQSSTTGASRM